MYVTHDKYTVKAHVWFSCHHITKNTSTIDDNDDDDDEQRFILIKFMQQWSILHSILDVLLKVREKGLREIEEWEIERGRDGGR